jgi:hypothetical protein
MPDIFSNLLIMIISYLTALCEPDAILSTDMKSLRDNGVPDNKYSQYPSALRETDAILATDMKSLRDNNVPVK